MEKNSVFSIFSQLKTLEVQVTGLRIQMQRLIEQEYGPLPAFADLEGVLEGKISTSEEEIDAILYREPPEIESQFTTETQKAA